MEIIFFIAIVYYLIYKNKPEKRKEHLQKTKDAWRTMKENVQGGGLTINDDELKQMIKNAKWQNKTDNKKYSRSDYAESNDFRERKYEQRKTQYETRSINSGSDHANKPYVNKKTTDIRGRSRGGVVRKGLFDKKDHGKTVERR